MREIVLQPGISIEIDGVAVRAADPVVNDRACLNPSLDEIRGLRIETRKLLVDIQRLHAASSTKAPTP